MTMQPIIQTAPPTTSSGRARGASRVVLGVILVMVGAVAVLARAAGLDLGASIGDTSWPLLIVAPGLLLFALAFTRTPPDGLGFVIGGSIVTTVGGILLVQANTDTWASWAYVWALIPAAAGLGMTVYGLLTRTSGLIGKGARLAVGAGGLYLAGWWYFDALLTTGEQPVDLRTWWPLAVIAVGLLIAGRALLEPRRRASRPTIHPDIEGGTTR
jgi:hypothetical protein